MSPTGAGRRPRRGPRAPGAGRTLLAAAVALALGVRADPARAEEPAAPVALDPLERALWVGQGGEAPAGPEGAEPAWLTRLWWGWWRLGPGARLAEPPAIPSSYASALVTERDHRERLGSAGLPEAGVLAGLPPDADGVLAHALRLQRYVYRPPAPEDDPDPEVSEAARAARDLAQERRRASFWLATIALGLLLALSAVVGLALRPRRPDAGS